MVVTLVVAFVALFGVILTVRQKQHTDRRDQWWKRVQWAADLMRSDEDTSRQVGIVALEAIIVETKKIDSSDDALLRSIIDVVLGLGETENQVGSEAPAPDDPTRVQRSLRWMSRVLRRASELLERASH